LNMGMRQLQRKYTMGARIHKAVHRFYSLVRAKCKVKDDLVHKDPLLRSSKSWIH